MIRQLSAREAKLVAVAILLGVLALAWYALVAPVVGGFADRAARRDELRAAYARDTRIAAQIPSIRRAADAQRADLARFVLVPAAGAGPSDLLRDRIAAAVAASGGALRGVEEAAAAPGAVKLRADLQLTTGQLAALLANLQRGAPLLIVDSLTVAADEAFQTNRSANMDVRLEVSARTAAPKPR